MSIKAVTVCAADGCGTKTKSLYEKMKEWQNNPTEETFNFMEGKTDYTKQLALLSSDEIKSKDLNNDNFLDLDEYIKAEIQDYQKQNDAMGRETSGRERDSVAIKAEMLFSIIDGKLTNDESDGLLSVEEIAQYNYIMDKAELDGITGEADGIFNADGCAYVTRALMSAFFKI